jgi:hypothetical protein
MNSYERIKDGNIRCGCGGEVVRVKRTECDEHGHDKFQWLQCKLCRMRTPERDGQYNTESHLEELIGIWERAIPQMDDANYMINFTIETITKLMMGNPEKFVDDTRMRMLLSAALMDLSTFAAAFDWDGKLKDDIKSLMDMSRVFAENDRREMRLETIHSPGGIRRLAKKVAKTVNSRISRREDNESVDSM